MNPRLFFIFLLFFALLLPAAAHAQRPDQDVLILCYHSILPKVPADDAMSVSQQLFGRHLEYLKSHGYNVISVETLLKAVRGQEFLPQNPVLLTFDDAYRSFYTTAYPILKRYGYPAMLAVVGSWAEGKAPQDLTEPLMTWSQIREVAQSGLVEIASHSWNLHRATRYNPSGNAGAMVSVPAYFESESRYETETEYREKLSRDFQAQNRIFTGRLGKKPRAMVWPYGWYNEVSSDVAKENGLLLGFSLTDGKASTAKPYRMSRLLMGEIPLYMFAYHITHTSPRPDPIRAMQVDLDLVYAPSSYEQTDRNLGLLIDRLIALEVNTVYLQAFSDAKGTGNIESVYFENPVLPVKADIFSHAVHQMYIRGLEVYAWMPTLSIRFPDEAKTAQWRVRAYQGGEARPSDSWYKRLTPFSPEVRARIGDLYEALAAHAQIYGVLFQDDAYLAEEEDHHPAALAAFSEHLGKPVSSADIAADAQLADRWTAFKTQALIDHTKALSERVRKYRPDARFARNIYANLLIKPHSEFWFAQNYSQFLDAYDQVVVMAYPQMEKAGNPMKWLRGIAETVAAHPQGPDRTVFKLQAYDWGNGQWVDSRLLLREMQAILSAGGRHLAYYPDNFWENRPSIDILRHEMSTQDVAGDYNGTSLPAHE